MGPFESVCRPVTDPDDRALVRSLPPPPPQEKTSTSYPKTSPHQISHHQCADPRIDSLGSPHLESKCSALAQGFTPKTRKRPCADDVKSAYLNPSCHRTGTTTVPRPKPECDQRYQRIPLLAHQEPHPSEQAGATFPHQAQSGREPARWTRAIRSLAPVRGLTPPSIPLPFHWRAETCSQTFSPRVMDEFSYFQGGRERRATEVE
jgi:hypothetical protein